MFKEVLEEEVLRCVKANHIYDAIEESSEEFDPSREYLSYANTIYNKCVDNNLDIENDPSVQSFAISVCQEAIKQVFLGLSNVSTQTPSERIDELFELQYGIKKQEKK